MIRKMEKGLATDETVNRVKELVEKRVEETWHQLTYRLNLATENWDQTW
jgi:hypothetical protein